MQLTTTQICELVSEDFVREGVTFCEDNAWYFLEKSIEKANDTKSMLNYIEVKDWYNEECC